jgi:hypothetical protein
MTNNFNEDLSLSRDYINVNVGKRIRMDCELNNSTINGNRKVNQINFSSGYLNKIFLFHRVYGYV